MAYDLSGGEPYSMGKDLIAGKQGKRYRAGKAVVMRWMEWIPALLKVVKCGSV